VNGNSYHNKSVFVAKIGQND